MAAEEVVEDLEEEAEVVGLLMADLHVAALGVGARAVPSLREVNLEVKVGLALSKCPQADSVKLPVGGSLAKNLCGHLKMGQVLVPGGIPYPARTQTLSEWTTVIVVVRQAYHSSVIDASVKRI